VSEPSEMKTKPVSSSNDCATRESYTVLVLLGSSSGNIPSCCGPNRVSKIGCH